jgi:hypothetical protein
MTFRPLATLPRAAIRSEKRLGSITRHISVLDDLLPPIEITTGMEYADTEGSNRTKSQ